MRSSAYVLDPEFGFSTHPKQSGATNGTQRATEPQAGPPRSRNGSPR
jgi:hypothetical protein